jgi:hypothetical protein
MAYVPGCRYDLFISYATENNRDGWVDQFQAALGQEVSDLLGNQFNPKDSVFFDKRNLQVAQSFPHELAAAAQGSAILVPILSPHYLTSDWCDRERTEFFSQLPHGAAPPDCLAPIQIRPVGPLPASFGDAHRLSFLAADGRSPLPPGAPEWINQVRTLASQLADALQKLRRKYKPFFLGKADSRLRSSCVKELEARYFRTVPEYLPELDDPETIRGHLETAGLAIHFLGGAGAGALETIQSSVEICSGLTLLYQPFGAALNADERLWLADFERQLPAGSRYQRLSGKNQQELLSVITDHTVRSQTDSTPKAGAPDLTVICDEPDLEAVRLLKTEILSRRPATVDFPDFLGGRLKPTERLRKWHEFLARGEVLLFYHGAAEGERLEMIWEKAEQYRGDVRRGWFLGPPDIDLKLRKHPDALSTVDQIIGFLEVLRSAPPR